MLPKIVKGTFKLILEKYESNIIGKISDKTKDEWEKFKIDFDLAFIKYEKNAQKKYSKVKTLLYRTEPKDLYDFFEKPYIISPSNRILEKWEIDNLLDISNYLLVQGSGGMGKSTLVKYLFIEELKQKDLIPIYFELKDINSLSEKYDLIEILLKKLNNLGGNLTRKYFEYALESGCFFFILDGYDEITAQNQIYFLSQLNCFCDKYQDNYYVVTSRPYSDFVEFERFSVIATKELDKKQAISLINKIEFDIDIKTRFIDALNDHLYESHKSFASNPLLLNIMLLTYDNYADIPEKLHLFYANAFETLYSRHDATKAGFRREMLSKLSYDSFVKVFSYFCFITYSKADYEFPYEDMRGIFEKIKISGIDYDADNYIKDLINSVCVIFKDGNNYKFTHRSFQEYFAALFIKELADDKMEKIGIEIIKRDIYRTSHDMIFKMLYDMCEERFSVNILLPIMNELEKDRNNKNSYDFYLQKLVKGISFHSVDNNKRLCIHISDNIMQFINSMDQYCVSKTAFSDRTEEQIEAERQLMLILGDSHRIVKCSEIMNNKELYDLVSRSWIGERINSIAGLYARLQKKKSCVEENLYELIGL